MDITFFGYKFRVELLIIIVLLWWIMCGHMLCGCCNVPLPQVYEAFTGRRVGATARGGDKNRRSVTDTYLNSKL
jgi:hypothetical protein